MKTNNAIATPKYILPLGVVGALTGSVIIKKAHSMLPPLMT
jgi:hypothetical protein